jgi:hypothetical protein
MSGSWTPEQFGLNFEYFTPKHMRAEEARVILDNDGEPLLLRNGKCVPVGDAINDPVMKRENGISIEVGDQKRIKDRIANGARWFPWGGKMFELEGDEYVARKRNYELRPNPREDAKAAAQYDRERQTWTRTVKSEIAKNRRERQNSRRSRRQSTDVTVATETKEIEPLPI